MSSASTVLTGERVGSRGEFVGSTLTGARVGEPDGSAFGAPGFEGGGGGGGVEVGPHSLQAQTANVGSNET